MVGLGVMAHFQPSAEFQNWMQFSVLLRWINSGSNRPDCVLYLYYELKKMYNRVKIWGYVDQEKVDSVWIKILKVAKKQWFCISWVFINQKLSTLKNYIHSTWSVNPLHMLWKCVLLRLINSGSHISKLTPFIWRFKKKKKVVKSYWWGVYINFSALFYL